MKKIILASNNKHKIEEIKAILKDFEVYSLNDINFYEDIQETGKTFEDNALIKAEAILNFAKNLEYDYILADDSGLCVDALNGEPGVFSARYYGDHNEQANRQKILDR
ncbi:MAG: non-canonical purine NTP pyrophosphatase, partial [Clostridia bacterium]|nr:non-canonical purine NTP pyrophosphatase [Clostridia bacterium]